MSAEWRTNRKTRTKFPRKRLPKPITDFKFFSEDEVARDLLRKGIPGYKWERINSTDNIEYILRSPRSEGWGVEMVGIEVNEDYDPEPGEEPIETSYEVTVFDNRSGDAESIDYGKTYDDALKIAKDYVRNNPTGGSTFYGRTAEEYEEWRKSQPHTWIATFNTGEHSGDKWLKEYVTAYGEEDARDKLRTERGHTSEVSSRSFSSRR